MQFSRQAPPREREGRACAGESSCLPEWARSRLSRSPPPSPCRRAPRRPRPSAWRSRRSPIRAPSSRRMKPKPPQPAADIGARRFTGRVGADMSHSLLAAGVPERQGREYIALLGRAIDLAGGLTVDDRFDLVIERTPDGKLARLLYAGLDRVGRADVELLKWTDGKQVIWVNADGVGGENSQGMRMPVSGPRDLAASVSASTRSSATHGSTPGVDLAATFGSADRRRGRRPGGLRRLARRLRPPGRGDRTPAGSRPSTAT